MAEGPRIVVGVSDSLACLAAVHRAVDEARRREACLVPVHAWAPAGGEGAYRRSPCPPLLKEWENAAVERLTTTFEQAFGGWPAGLRVTPLVVRGDVGSSLVRIADRADDLLVVGAGRHGGLRRLFHGSVARYCLAHATCAMLAVPPSELLTAAERPWRGGDPAAWAARPPRTTAS